MQSVEYRAAGGGCPSLLDSVGSVRGERRVRQNNEFSHERDDPTTSSISSIPQASNVSVARLCRTDEAACNHSDRNDGVVRLLFRGAESGRFVAVVGVAPRLAGSGAGLQWNRGAE